MFLYFGAKARLAHTYQAPRHDLIIEPFAGAAGYSMHWLTRRPDLRCLLIDPAPWTAAVWERLLSMDPMELWDYPLPTQGERTTDPLYHCGAVSAGTYTRWATAGDYQVTEWMARSFPTKRRQMAHTLSQVQGRVEFARGDYTDAPDIEATWFIDPPYQKEGHQYDSGNDLDWPALGEWCRARSGQVIVCESDGADWLDFEHHVSTQDLVNNESVEVVWYSHPEPDLLSLMEEAQMR